MMNYDTPPNQEQIRKIFELTPDMWEQYKDIRLQSGETDPEAFGQSIQEESEKDELYWRSKLSIPNAKMFAIEVGGKVAGMAGFEQKPDGAFYLRRLYISPEMRGTGLGRDLVKWVLDEVSSLGAKTIKLGVTGDTEEQLPAIRLYEKMGFSEISSKESLMGDGKLHKTIVMEKRL